MKLIWKQWRRKKIVTAGRVADIDTRKARSAEIEGKVQARKARGYGDRG